MSKRAAITVAFLWLFCTVGVIPASASTSEARQSANHDLYWVGATGQIDAGWYMLPGVSLVVDTTFYDVLLYGEMAAQAIHPVGRSGEFRVLQAVRIMCDDEDAIKGYPVSQPGIASPPLSGNGDYGDAVFDAPQNNRGPSLDGTLVTRGDLLLKRNEVGAGVFTCRLWGYSNDVLHSSAPYDYLRTYANQSLLRATTYSQEGTHWSGPNQLYYPQSGTYPTKVSPLWEPWGAFTPPTARVIVNLNMTVCGGGDYGQNGECTQPTSGSSAGKP